MPKGSGRRPLPTKLKKLRGNAGKRKLNDAEPQPDAGEPEMPPGLLPLAQAEWRRIVPELLRLEVLSKIDGKALAGYCMAYARWMQAEADVAKYGLTIEEPVVDTVTGQQRFLGEGISVSGDGDLIRTGRPLFRLKRNPAISVSHDAQKLMKSFLVEFGMTPAARTRLRVEKSEKSEDPLEALMKRNALPSQTSVN